MPIKMTVNGANPGVLISPHGKRTFPALLRLKSTSNDTVQVKLAVSDAGAGISLDQSDVVVDSVGTDVRIHALSISGRRNDVTINAFVNGVLEGSIGITCIDRPRLLFDGRFEVRFATGSGAYNHPRGNPDGTGSGWMWALEGEPDFVPADSVPERIEKPVGRVIRFHNPVAPRAHVPPIGVFCGAIHGHTTSGMEVFTSGDPVIGMPVNLGANTYFGSNQPVSNADRAAGKLPEEQHDDGFQPLALFELHFGNWFSGTSKTGPYVPGTVESNNPRSPDSRPRGQGLEPLTSGEIAAFPFPSIEEFSETRLGKLLVDFSALKAAGQTGTVEFRNLKIRIGHLLPDVNTVLRSQVLTDHSDVGMTVLSGNAPFAYGQFREVYRGMIDQAISVNSGESPFLSYLVGFGAIHFLGVFFNFHTDEACAHVYGSVDPTQAPPTL